MAMSADRIEGGSPAAAGGDSLVSAVAPTHGAAERAALPSMERRAHRGRVLTLVGFVATIVVSALGLWGIAVLLLG